ncbi:NACHT domain- and WD repeat-containing protein 1 isoform X2 [Denticeps clupeoides]|uniref:NACHT domain- and WD repeat-containing protein 1 isoform X2 n=1 Tax=Denticeps clupeoides TaxID=299321 RepID=UPI0010A30216|nr:NACHT domain- and WD repeat-containing protein 1 isoform X2 [Denticeps clupeoides]
MNVSRLREALNKAVLRGQAPASSQLQSNVVRVFISSSFGDMNEERNALMEKSYSELQSFCQSLGLVYEVVDLRWGVRDGISVDSMTIGLCLEEIQSCKKISVGPSFVVLLGNSYGHRPIPHLISEYEFELLLSKHSDNLDSVKFLNKWYWKDDNSVPPSYVLQPISMYFPHYDDMDPESGPLRDNDILSWHYTEARLLTLLRTAALQAEKDGDITAAQKQKFFKSVIDWEIEHGLQGVRAHDTTMVLAVREMQKVRKKEAQRNLMHFTDVTADGLVDVEAQELLANLKSQLFSTYADNIILHSVELSKNGIDPTRKVHAQYLDSLCEQFVSQMKAKISRKAVPEAQCRAADSSWLLQEINHHTRLSSAKCSVFCGRESLLGKLSLKLWESTLTTHPPLVVYGPPGMGKTALMCKLQQEMRSLLGPRAVVVVRLLGTSYYSSDVDLMLWSICLQICRAFGLPQPSLQTSNSFEELVRFLNCTLSHVSERGESLLLVLDSLDQLSLSNSAHKLRWLPREIPPNVHVVVSARDTGLPLSYLRGMLEDPGRFFEVDRLSCDQGRDIIDAYLRSAGRCLVPEQSNAVLWSFQTTGSPLFLKVTLDMAKQWASYADISDVHIGNTAEEALSLFLQSLEMKHGRQLVTSALGFIVSSRQGLSEAEIRDLLSLDDTVLAEIYHNSLPPNHTIVRLPPLLWTRLRHDLGDHLLQGQANGIPVLSVYHRQFMDVVRERYLSAEQKTQRHTVLAEYFLGIWSNGNTKPLHLPSIQTNLNTDRKVPSQPLWLTDGVANLRKLHELPYHLISADKWEDLCHIVIGSMEWLSCKTLTCGVSSVIQDLSLCTKPYDCPEILLIQDTLELLKPTLDFIDGRMNISLLYTEIFARLYTLAEIYPALIGTLCSQCQDWFASCPDPILVPRNSFLPSPGGELKITLTGFIKGVTVIDICSQSEILVAGSEDGLVIAWNLKDFGVMHIFTGHKAGVRSLRMMSCGAYFLSSGGDCTLRRWNLHNGREKYCIHGAVSASLQSTPQFCVMEERLVVFTHSEGQVKAWHLETAEFLYNVVMEGTASILGVLEGTVSVLSEGGLITFYDSSTGLEKMQTALTSRSENFIPTCCLNLLKHRKLLIASQEGFLYLISETGKQIVNKLPSSISFLSVSEDEKMLFAGCEKTLVVLHVGPNSIDSSLDLQHDDNVLAAAASGLCQVVVSGSEDQVIRVWCLSSGKLLDSFYGMGSPVTSLAAYGHLVMSASSSTNCLKVWQMDYNPSHRTKSRIPGNCCLVTLSKDGENVFYVRRGNRNEINTWNSSTGTTTETMDASAEVWCLELAQKKKLLFCGLKTGTIMIYPSAFPLETLCIPPPESLSKVHSMAVSSHEDWLAVAYEDSVCLFEITTRDSFPSVEGPFEKYTLPLLQPPLTAIALLVDCRLIFGTEGGDVTMYDFKSASTTALESHDSKITCVTLSNWGTHALIGSQNCVQKLWGLTPLLLQHTMEYKGFFFEGVLCATFSANDKFVFTGSDDRTIKVWEVSSGKLLFVQYVYSPVIRMMPNRDGLVGVSELGLFIKEGFRCPGGIRAAYNALQNFRAQFRVISKVKKTETRHTVIKETDEAKHKAKASHTCNLL